MRGIYLKEETGDFAFSKSDMKTIAKITKNKSDVNTMDHGFTKTGCPVT